MWILLASSFVLRFSIILAKPLVSLDDNIQEPFDDTELLGPVSYSAASSDSFTPNKIPLDDSNQGIQLFDLGFFLSYLVTVQELRKFDRDLRYFHQSR